jgi:F0F1-type ATP synthase assembly protein I
VSADDSGTGEEPTPSSDLPSSAGEDPPGFAAFASLGMTIAVCVGIGVGLGIWLDDVAGSAPWGLFGGLLLGAALAVVSVIQLARQWL